MRNCQKVFAVVALVLALCCASASAESMLKLYFARDPSAVCLDGSPGAFYVRHSNTSSWVIYFQGGAWCVNLPNCQQRTTTGYGSSKNYKHQVPSSIFGGPLSDDCTVNPTFCNFNLVVINYCDGGSFTGTRSKPIIHNGTTLYFRGKAIRESAFNDLKDLFGLGSATEVVLTGGSAGGLSTILHADWVGQWLQKNAPKVTKYRALPIGGFFLHHSNVEYLPVMENQFKGMFYLAESANNGTSPTCLAAFPPQEQWRCVIAEFVLALIKVPTFVLNSRYDMWQVPCIFTAMPETDGWVAGISGNCSFSPGYEKCHTVPFKFHGCYNSTTIRPVLAFGADYASRILDTAELFTPLSGAFITSCFTHCEPLWSSRYTTIKVRNVTIRDAVDRWWADDGTAQQRGSSDHFYIDCDWSSTPPFLCNPTCPQVAAGFEELKLLW